MGIREKLLSLFVGIKVFPLVVLACIAWLAVVSLGDTVSKHSTDLIEDSRTMVDEVGSLAVRDSINALDEKSREAIERLSTDTAQEVADFLYDCDKEIINASEIPRTLTAYKHFLKANTRDILLHHPWVLDPDLDRWSPTKQIESVTPVTAQVDDNRKDFHSRPAFKDGYKTTTPLFHEITFFDKNGVEKLKATSTELLSPEKRNISKKENTYCKAEEYFSQALKLKPGEIYVSEVIGEYLPSPVIGPYTKSTAQLNGVKFEPEKSGYAGKENPVGKKFKGIVRWVTPVTENGKIIGYVSLALDHTHIMEFTDHIVPTDERYTSISDASTGNYAFMWDFKGRNISHPRDYFIVGYDAETGEPAVPWLDKETYKAYKATSLTTGEFLGEQREFLNPSLRKTPDPEQTHSGYVGLDGRYLNFAPQCTGWHNLTQHGGSGSFVIFWSGLWKLTTAATIPYYTGQYKDSPRGFGYITIGANVYEFHKAATATAEKIQNKVDDYEKDLIQKGQELAAVLVSSLEETASTLTISTIVMCLIVIVIAVALAGVIRNRITSVVNTVKDFQEGNFQARLPDTTKDEWGELTEAFNGLVEEIEASFLQKIRSEEKYQSIFDHSVEGIFRSSVDGKFLEVNPSMASMLGYESAQDMIDSISDVRTEFYLHPELRDQYLKTILKKGRVNNFEFEAIKADGSTVWVKTNTHVVRSNEDKILYLEGILVDISARKEMEKARSQQEAAEAASMAKSEFLATMSHEIRSPMHIVIGVADLLAKSRLTSRQKELVKLLRTSGDNLLNLLNDILDISKIEAGEISLEYREFSVRKLISDICQSMRPQAEDKGLLLNCHIDDNVSDLVQGDEGRLRQVLINLVGNACKFTDVGEIAVDVTCLKMEGVQAELKFVVQDTGIGIAEDKLDTIFDMFTQAESGASRQYGGTGLGLAISKKLTQLMGGNITVASQPGEGCTFSFTVKLITINSMNPSHEILPATDVEPERVLPDRDEPVRVLLADDSEFIRILMETYLQEPEFNLDMVEDGQQAIDMYRNNVYELVLMDIQMPVVDGYAAISEIRHIEEELGKRPIPIIALTANAMIEDKKRCLSIGASGYLPKPFKRQNLIDKIKRILGS
ncbi:MAG: ATP-binding protein [Desulfovibrio sp.]